MIKILLGLVLGFLIGAGCRWFDIPAPSPPTLIVSTISSIMSPMFFSIFS